MAATHSLISNQFRIVKLKIREIRGWLLDYWSNRSCLSTSICAANAGGK